MAPSLFQKKIRFLAKKKVTTQIGKFNAAKGQKRSRKRRKFYHSSDSWFLNSRYIHLAEDLYIMHHMMRHVTHPTSCKSKCQKGTAQLPLLNDKRWKAISYIYINTYIHQRCTPSWFYRLPINKDTDSLSRPPWHIECPNSSSHVIRFKLPWSWCLLKCSNEQRSKKR